MEDGRVVDRSTRVDRSFRVAACSSPRAREMVIRAMRCWFSLSTASETDHLSSSSVPIARQTVPGAGYKGGAGGNRLDIGPARALPYSADTILCSYLRT